MRVEQAGRRRIVAIAILAVLVVAVIGYASRRDAIEDGTPIAATDSPSPMDRTASPTLEPSIAITAAPASTEPPTAPRAGEDPQPPAARGRSVARSDPAGDLLDVDTSRSRGRPRYADIVGFEAAIDDGELVARFELAGRAPASLDPLHTTVHYHLMIDTDQDGFQDYSLNISSVEDWAVNLFGGSETFDQRRGVGAVDGDVVMLRVPLSDIGSPTRVAVHGYTEWTDYPDPQGDPLVSTTAQDRVPSNEDRWLMLSVE